MLAWIALLWNWLDQIIEENEKFELTTFRFNDQKSSVPSGSLNRVPTVKEFFYLSSFLSIFCHPKRQQNHKIFHKRFFYSTSQAEIRQTDRQKSGRQTGRNQIPVNKKMGEFAFFWFLILPVFFFICFFCCFVTVCSTRTFSGDFLFFLFWKLFLGGLLKFE